ncbi:tetratricopeptide repeat protein [Actomonas aquatica]|uniref:Tetratricopeptide repeat protein n=1 Tax=Actomonas aquatica TaxID=2866162 RepID=A0ABZ1CES8_9BACT|nr:tetratricopeptide repeat protein [Opitutus sp. WL0086]WRQ90003.1 tetratricopeptide repeat protein [Opitutus sp. WL0086]
MTRRLALALLSALLGAVPLAAQNPFAASAPYKGVYAGKHAQVEVALRLLADDERYTGTLRIGPRDYTLQATPTPQQLEGEFYDEAGAAAPFVCRVSADGKTLIIARDSGDIRLQRVAVPDNIWGHWEGKGVQLLLSQAPDTSAVSGMIFFQGGKFPLQGRYDVGLLEGSFQSDDQSYPFTVHARMEELHFISGPFAERLTPKSQQALWAAFGLIPNAFGAIEADEEVSRQVTLLHRKEVVDALIEQENFQLEVEEATTRQDALLLAAAAEKVGTLQSLAENLMQRLHEARDYVAATRFQRANELMMSDDPSEDDLAQAFTLLNSAAEWGHASAMSALGLMYFKGQGVEHDEEACLEWTRRAAEKGHVVAMSNMGFLLERGIGAEADVAEALRWYELAADEGNELALESVRRLRGSGDDR